MIKHFCDRCGKPIPKEHTVDPSTIALCEDSFKDNIDLCPTCMRLFDIWWRGASPLKMQKGGAENEQTTD